MRFIESTSAVTQIEPFPDIDLACLGLKSVFDFPIGVFPSVIRQVVIDVAARIGTHPDFIAVSMLAVMGAAIGRSVLLQLKQGFEVWPSSWYAVVGLVGSGKSPAIRFAEQPLVHYESVLDSENQAAAAAFEAYCASLPKGEVRPPKPIPKRIRMREATFAALIEAHSGNPHGLLYSPDELTTWFRGMDSKNRATSVDRSNWLSARQGSDISQDRISCGTRRVEKPAITLLGSIPPDMLAEITGSEQDGLIERLLFVFPHFERVPMPRLEDDQQAHDINASDWSKTVKWLIQARFDSEGKERITPHKIFLNADRQAVVAYHEFECRMANAMNDDDGPLRGFYSKIKWDVGHWAMTLALAELGSNLTDVLNQSSDDRPAIVMTRHIENAAAIADYFLACAGKVISGGAKLRKMDRRIIRKIVKTKPVMVDSTFLNSSFNGQARPSPTEFENMLMRFVRANIFIEPTSLKGPFRVNPKVWDLQI